MRFTVFLAAVLAFSTIILTNSQEVSAKAENGSEKLTSTDVLVLLDRSSLAEKLASKDISVKVDDKTIEHVVSEGDTLISIAESYDVDWKRIFSKNENITDPNTLNPGITIVIPDESEKLDNRTIDTPVAEPVTAESTGQHVNSYSYASSAGNSYVYGYCTWYAKQRRPDLPNQLGNAYSWVVRARAMGIPTGSKAVAGAIGQRGNHVVYVEKVNGDGTITISDMNYAGRGIVTKRTVSENSHTYIY